MDRTQYGPWALIAGGSEGLGASFAQLLAAAGFNLVLCGRNPEPLAESATRLAALGVEVRARPLDLTAPGMLEAVRAATDDIEVGLLIYNAGANSYASEFVEGDLARFQSVIDVNIPARLALCHHFGKHMKDRGRGGMILVGSIAGYRGSPGSQVYNATKAFTRVFAEGLWYELKDSGVDVIEFVVGPMKTPAMARRGMTFGPDVADPDAVAAEGLAHITDGPVWVSEFAGGEANASHQQSYPRDAVVMEAAELLRSLGLYPPK